MTRTNSGERRTMKNGIKSGIRGSPPNSCSLTFSTRSYFTFSLSQLP